MKVDLKLIDTILNRGVDEIIERESLVKKLNSGKKLRVKLGIDPTKPDIHLGHTVPLRKLRQFQELGHQIVLIIGDFTAQIGDPSGQSAERKPITEKEVKSNMKHYIEQAAKVIDVKKAEIRWNSEWHKKEGLAAMLNMAKAVTFQQVIKRADFQKRIDAGNDISMIEMLYPLLQGYDSVKIKADVEVGGTDQKFNLLMGRRVQRHFGQPEQDIITVPLIEGTDGVRKMSKSYGNYVGVMENPNDMFGKIMSVPDNLIEKYFTLLTDEDMPNTGPYEAKMELAETIVRAYHSEKEAIKAKESFIRTFSKKEAPENVPEIRVKNKKISLLDLLLSSGVESKSEARRLIQQKAIKVDEAVKNDPDEVLNLRGGEILKVGKHRFFKIV